MPTLPLLMKKDFPHMLLKLHGKPVFNFADGPYPFEEVLHTDFDAGIKIIGFYIPASQRSFEICAALSRETSRLGDALTHDPRVVVVRPGENPRDWNALSYTNTVYLYHEDYFTNQQKADIEEAFKKERLDVILRGPEYQTAAWLAWKRAGN